MANPSSLAGDTPALIAFYLPQFHPTPENDAWWGTGFTEWTNVTKATPQFRGHVQPRLPADLGFYDLRLPEVREAQAALARDHGVHGFCYYHYWFNGRRLLSTPFDAVRRSGAPDMPFCLCWANESWTRAWDGGSRQVLVEQTYDAADDRAHIAWLADAFRDPRYIRIEGRPLFLVYRAEQLPDALATTRVWREEARRLGVGELYLMKVDSFADRTPPEALGFDAAVEFQPDMTRMVASVEGTEAWVAAHGDDARQSGHTVYEYAEIVRRMTSDAGPYPRVPCVVPGWDNTARRARGATIVHGATPTLYAEWLRHAVARAASQPGVPRLVFVNAWNEWAEGAYLEPDRRWGRAFLEATRDALRGVPVATDAVAREPELVAPPAPLHYVRRYDDPDHAHARVLELARGARRVLDVGAATGYLSEALMAQGADVLAVEPDPRSAAIAAGRGVDVRVGTVPEVVGPDERFDCVLAADVLEHVVDGPQFLRELVRHVAPGGSLVLSVPNIAYISMRWSLLRGGFTYTDTGLLDRTHLRFYTHDTLHALLADLGLTVVERRYTVGPSVLRRWRLTPLDALRRRVLRSLAWRWPSLFALQFILKLAPSDPRP